MYSNYECCHTSKRQWVIAASYMLLVIPACMFALYAVVGVFAFFSFGILGLEYLYLEQVGHLYGPTVGILVLVSLFVASIYINIRVCGITVKHLSLLSMIWICGCIPCWFVGGTLLAMCVMASM